MIRGFTRASSVALALLLVCAAAAVAQKNCVKGIPCGNTCIAATKTCRIGTTTTVQPPTSANAAIPEGMQFVASRAGTTYYYVGCSGWRSLAPSNLRYFKSATEAVAAGYKPSTQSGCAGPATAAAPRPVSGTTSTVMSGGAVCVIESVTDGDTLRCVDGRRVRLLLIDAPEVGQGPYGALAKTQLEHVAPVGTSLRVEYDVQKQDQYDRDLAYLYLSDGQSVNEHLLRAGVAVVSVYPPNVKYVDQYRMVSDSAKMGLRGLWATPGPCCVCKMRRGRITHAAR